MMITQAISDVCAMPATTLSVKIEGRGRAGGTRGGREKVSVGAPAAAAAAGEVDGCCGAGLVAEMLLARKASTAARTLVELGAGAGGAATAFAFLGVRSPVR